MLPLTLAPLHAARLYVWLMDCCNLNLRKVEFRQNRNAALDLVEQLAD
jgi:hypothetical protein